MHKIFKRQFNDSPIEFRVTLQSACPVLQHSCNLKWNSALVCFTHEIKLWFWTFPSNSGFVQLLFQPIALWNTSACHLIFWNNLLSFSNWYLLICIFLCYQWFRMKKTWELDSAISTSEPPPQKIALPRIQRHLHNKEQNSIAWCPYRIVEALVLFTRN